MAACRSLSSKSRADAVLALLVALALLKGASALSCAANTYSYGGTPCATCPADATFISSTSGCAPSSTLTAGPSDTAFYLSGSQTEGVSAFSTVAAPAGVSFSTSVFGAAGGALSLASGSYLAAAGASAPTTLPAGGNVSYSVSAWVKCAPPGAYAAALEWGAAGNASVGLAASLTVSSVGGLATAPPTAVGVVGLTTTFAGSITGFADGAGAASAFREPDGIAVIPSTNVLVVADSYNYRLRIVSPLGVVTTLAGSSTRGTNDGTGTSAGLYLPQGVAVLPTNNLIVFSDSNLIRLCTYPGGVVTTLAGNFPGGGFSDGSANAASFNNPTSLAFIASSSVIAVTDAFNNAIRLVTYPGGIVTTLAGSTQGTNDGTGAGAQFYWPTSIAVVASSSALVVADTYNNRIRLVSYPQGVVTTFAGGIQGAIDGTGTAAQYFQPSDFAFISPTSIAVVDSGNNCVRLLSFPQGVTSTLAGSCGSVSGTADGKGGVARYYIPLGAALLPSCGILVTDAGSSRLRLITFLVPSIVPACDSTWHHAALTYAPPSSLSVFLDGVLIAQAAALTTLPPASASSLRIGWSGDLTSGGSHFAGTLSELRIYHRTLSPTEVVALSQPLLTSFVNAASSPSAPVAAATSYRYSCLAGSAGAGGSFVKNSSTGAWAWAGEMPPNCTVCAANTYSYGGAMCAVCPANAAFISSTSGCAPSSTLTAGPSDTAFYLSGTQTEGVSAFSTLVQPLGAAFVSNPLGASASALNLSAGSYLAAAPAAGSALALALPSGFDAPASVCGWIKCASSGGTASIVSWGSSGSNASVSSSVPPQLGLSLQVKAAGTVAAATQVVTVSTFGSWGVYDPVYLAVNGSSIVFSDSTLSSIFQLSSSGVVSTLASGFAAPIGLAISPLSGNVMLADCNSHCIYSITPAGVATIFAGSTSQAGGSSNGVGTNARFNCPWGLAISSTGLIAVAEATNNLIRLVTPGGVVSTLAGSGSAGCMDGTGTSSNFTNPRGAAFDSQGNVFVADMVCGRIRRITPQGVTTTLAGCCDGGSADGHGTSASFNRPQGVAVDVQNNVIVADTNNNRLRMVTPQGLVSTLAGSANSGGIPIDGSGSSATFGSLYGIAVDAASGRFFVAAPDDKRLRLVTMSASVVVPACDSTWHHAALTYAPGLLSAFLSGVLVAQATASVTLPPASASALRIGWSGDLTSSGSLFAGALSEMRIYNRTLSPTEVVALSQPPLHAFPNTDVRPPVPTAGSSQYVFVCSLNSTGRGGTLAVSDDGTWEWYDGMTPLCNRSSVQPSVLPTATASFAPSMQPTVTASVAPNVQPTANASLLPSLQPAAIGASGNAPLSPSMFAGVAVLILLLACAAAYIGLARLRLKRQIEQLTSKTTQASRALDRARLLALQATPNAPEFSIDFEQGTVRSISELAGKSLPLPSSSLNSSSPPTSFINVLRSAAITSARESLSTTSGATAPAVDPERKERVAEVSWGELTPDLTIMPKFGAFGAVFVARWVPKRKIVAVKVLKSAMLTATQSQSAVEMLMHEAQGLMRASDGGANVNVVQVFGVAQGLAGGWQGAQRLARATEDQAERRRRLRSLAALAADGAAASNVDVSSDGEDEGDIGLAQADKTAADANAGPAPYLFGLVMSFESGGSLQETLFPRRGVSWPITMVDRLRVLKEIATGLYQLHATGLVHGDLKLENVLLTGDERHVRLADFGLATLRASASRATRMSTIVEAKATRGTYSYMAPEMFASRTARAAAASRSTDVFAFGTLAWELLASKHAWDGHTEAERSLALGRGESLDASALPRDTPSNIGALVARCTALERRDRPRMAEAVAVVEQAHENLLSGHFDVFLSYCWGRGGARKPLADEIYIALRASGLRVWLDEAEMGMDLAASMSDGIAKSDVVVALVSPDYAASPNCMHELREAARMGKPLITCCVEPGFWRAWTHILPDGAVARTVPDDHELALLARLATHLFADLGAASRVNWAGDAVSAADRRLLQLPEALPRLLKLFSETRTALNVEKSKGATAASREAKPLSTRVQAEAALDAASAARDAASQRLSDVEVQSERRVAEARRKVEAAQQAQQSAAAVLSGAPTGANLDEALDRVNACHAALRIATTEERRVCDAEGLRVAEARTALAACSAARELAATALIATRRETAS